MYVKKDIMDNIALVVNELTIKYGDVCQVVDTIVANKQQLVNIRLLNLWALVIFWLGMNFFILVPILVPPKLVPEVPILKISLDLNYYLPEIYQIKIKFVLLIKACLFYYFDFLLLGLQLWTYKIYNSHFFIQHLKLLGLKINYLKKLSLPFFNKLKSRDQLNF